MAKEASKDTKKAPAASGAATGQTTAAGEKKSSPLKVVGLLAAVLVLEGGTVFVTMFLSKGPDKVQAKSLVSPEEADANKLVELLVAKEQFDNQRGNRVMIYDTEIYVTVPQKDKERIAKQIEAMQAQISTDLSAVFRKAEPTNFLEPTRATLTRQVKAALDERLGKGADGQGVVHDALIRKCIGFQAG
jgi:hypothetical protein